MELARKQLVVVNPKKKRKKARGKKRRAHRARNNPGKSHKKHARRRHRSTAPRRARRRSSSARRRNPSLGHAALSTGAAIGVGAAAAVVSQVAGHLLGEAAATAEEPKPKLATALRIGVPAVLAVGGGLAVSMLNHTAGKAVAAGAGAVSALQAASAVAAKLGANEDGSANALQKGGLQLLSGEEYVIKGSHVYRRLSNGREQLLFGATPRAYTKLRMSNGQVGKFGVLGNIGQRAALLTTPSGQLQVLEGYQFDSLAGYQTDPLD